MLANLKVKRLENFIDFKKSKYGDAGWDLYSTENIYIPTCGRVNSHGIWLTNKDWVVIDVGVSVSCDPEWYMRIAPRSGMAVKNGIHVLGGVIDSSYRGPLKVALINLGPWDYQINKGDKIAQLIPTRTTQESFEFVDDLEDSDRGENGFGSTGK